MKFKKIIFLLLTAIFIKELFFAYMSVPNKEEKSNFYVITDVIEIVVADNAKSFFESIKNLYYIFDNIYTIVNKYYDIDKKTTLEKNQKVIEKEYVIGKPQDPAPYPVDYTGKYPFE